MLADKLINEIQRLMFDQHFYCRFLKGYNFDVDKAIEHLALYLAWRKKQNIDTVLVSKGPSAPDSSLRGSSGAANIFYMILF